MTSMLLIVIAILIYACVTLCKKAYIRYKLINTQKEIKHRYHKLMYILRSKHNNDIFVQRLLDNTTHKIVLVRNPSTQGFGYNINKGEEIGLCMQNYKTGFPNQTDDIFYVLLHELAHIMTTTYTHDEEFHTNFDFLCKIASQNNIFKLRDYKNIPSEFCNGYIK
jgi:hypothetical protein